MTSRSTTCQDARINGISDGVWLRDIIAVGHSCDPIMPWHAVQGKPFARHIATEGDALDELGLVPFDTFLAVDGPEYLDCHMCGRMQVRPKNGVLASGSCSCKSKEHKRLDKSLIAVAESRARRLSNINFRE